MSLGKRPHFLRGLGVAAFWISFGSLLSPLCFSATYTNVVLVNAWSYGQDGSRLVVPFYIEIFEISADEAKRLVPEIEYSTTGKPTRMTSVQAAKVCERKGMRLPTKEEWLMAASAMGQNKNYSLAGDAIQRADGTFAANIAGGNSINIYDINAIGIDAIGTVGMTGNRSEYYKNANGSVGLCGGEYETQDPALVHLSRICGFASNENSTARCVLTADKEIQVQLNDLVTQPIRDQIARAAKFITPFSSAVLRTKLSIEDFLIDPAPLPSEDPSYRLSSKRNPL